MGGVAGGSRYVRGSDRAGEVAKKARKPQRCSNCFRTGHTLPRCLKGNFYSTLGPSKVNPWPAPSITLKLGDIIVVWDLETTGLSVYQQEPLEIGYAILRVVTGAQDSLLFERVGATVSTLTLSDMVASPEALATHGITPEKLAAGGVPLVTALDQLGSNVSAAKGGKDLDVFFLGANSDAFDMRMMQYTLARRWPSVDEGSELAWFDLLTGLGVVGTIDTIRLVPSLNIIEGLNGKNGRSVGSMHQLILGRPLVGAHRAGTDVDGVVHILCDKRVTTKVVTVPSATPLPLWLEHSNHSKARLGWEAQMIAEIAAEKASEIEELGVSAKQGHPGHTGALKRLASKPIS